MEVSIDLTKINNWDDFHSQFTKEMGFPGFHGKNMNAWIDCISYIDDPESGMSEMTIKPNQSLNIIVIGTDKAFEICPEIIKEFIICTSFVNKRFIESESNTRLRVITI